MPKVVSPTKRLEADVDEWAVVALDFFDPTADFSCHDDVLPQRVERRSLTLHVKKECNNGETCDQMATEMHNKSLVL